MNKTKVTNGYSVSSQLSAGYIYENPKSKKYKEACEDACYRNALRDQGYEGIPHTSLPEHLIAPFLQSFENCVWRECKNLPNKDQWYPDPGPDPYDPFPF